MRPETSVVYICSPDRYRQLALSLATLLRSGTRLDEIIVYCIGADPHWTFGDDRVRVTPVADRWPDYFYGNKLYVCDVDAERVVFLDTDTLVFSPLDRVWNGRSAQVIARVAAAYDSSNWNAELWRETCSRFGMGIVPMFNTGFIVFQDGAHRRVRQVWQQAIELYRNKVLRPPLEKARRPPFDERMCDQYGLPLALLAEHISYDTMTPREHTYGWREHTVGADTVVFHTTNSLFDKYAARFGIERWLGSQP